MEQTPLALTVLSAELDADTAPTETQVLLDAIDRAHRYDVALDLGRVEFMDSSGISTLMIVRNRVMSHGGSFVVRGARRHPARTLRMLGLDAVLGLEPTA